MLKTAVVRADAEREGEDGGGGEAAILDEHASRIRDILPELFEERAVPRVAHLFLDLLEALQLDERGAPRLGVRHAGAPPLVGRHVEVGAQLVVELALDARLAEDVPQKARESRGQGHGCPQDVAAMAAAMAPAMRSQLAVSASR